MCFKMEFEGIECRRGSLISRGSQFFVRTPHNLIGLQDHSQWCRKNSRESTCWSAKSTALSPTQQLLLVPLHDLSLGAHTFGISALSFHAFQSLPTFRRHARHRFQLAMLRYAYNDPAIT